MTTLVHLHKHWDIVKSRKKRQLVEEAVELMSTGRGPYNSHKPSCPKVEGVAPPHFNYNLGYEWDGGVVAAAAAKHHQIFNSDITAALRFTGYIIADTTILEYLDTTGSAPAFVWSKSGKPFRKKTLSLGLTRIELRFPSHWQPVYCDCDALDHVARSRKRNNSLDDDLLDDRSVSSPGLSGESRNTVESDRVCFSNSDSSLDETDIDMLQDADRGAYSCTNAGKRVFGLGYMEEGKEVVGVEFDGSVWVFGLGTKQFLSVADLARKDPRILRKKSQLYLWNLLTVAVFYSLPVVQLVLTYQLLYGIPQHYGLFYAMGASLIMEGILSGCYHVCPNHSNFQFDTSFMYVISMLCMVKIYQTRHPDINASAYATFGVLAIVIFIGMFGVLEGTLSFWVIFTVVHLVICLIVSAQIYYMGRWKFGNVCNWALAVYGLLYHLGDFATHLLMIFMANLMLYCIFYIVMKLCNHERILPQPLIYIILAFTTWVAALYFFLNKSISWVLTPAQSRAYNHPCEILDFYDKHDIWHFLSSASMFFSFMVLLTLDDDLIRVHRSNIPVF
uniref:(California timema) hypothetical protein n=1 Tax=Timema californicum TaxID=61474 RepID=A0A7R9P6H9_TIMCA|nr:unnamed protein product [Timema californicum]